MSSRQTPRPSFTVSLTLWLSLSSVPSSYGVTVTSSLPELVSTSATTLSSRLTLVIMPVFTARRAMASPTTATPQPLQPSRPSKRAKRTEMVGCNEVGRGKSEVCSYF